MTNVKVAVRYALHFNEELVGYRVALHGKNVITADIERDDLELLVDDFPEFFMEEHPLTGLSILRLVEKGNLLVTEGEENALIAATSYPDIVEKNGNGHLMSSVDLKQKYHYYNRLIFDNKLPKRISVRWNKNLRGVAGHCKTYFFGKTKTIERFEIALSPSYHEKFPEQIDSTLIHEMIHVALPFEKHNKKFHNMMNYINHVYGKQYNLNISLHSDETAVINYVYGCRKCGQTFTRYKRMKNIHLKYHVNCGGEIYLVEDRKTGYKDDDDMFDDTDWGQGRDW